MYAKIVLGSALLCYVAASSGMVILDARDEYPHQFFEPIVLRPVDDKIMSVDLTRSGPVLLGSSTALEYHTEDFGGINLAISGGSLQEIGLIIDMVPENRPLIISLDGHSLVHAEQRNRVQPGAWNWALVERALENPLDYFQYLHAFQAIQPRESASFYDESGNAIREFGFAKGEPEFQSHAKKFSNQVLTNAALENLDALMQKTQGRPGNSTFILSPVHPQLIEGLDDATYLVMQERIRDSMRSQCPWAQVYDMTGLEFSWDLFHDSIHFPREVGAEVMAHIEAGHGDLCAN